MNRKERHIIFNTLHSMHASSKIIREQEESQSNYSFFTDIEKAFLDVSNKNNIANYDSKIASEIIDKSSPIIKKLMHDIH